MVEFRKAQIRPITAGKGVGFEMENVIKIASLARQVRSNFFVVASSQAKKINKSFKWIAVCQSGLNWGD